MKDGINGLEGMIIEYINSPKVDFPMLQRWEAELINDPFALMKMYDVVVTEHAIAAPGVQKSLEPGLLGYIKGRKLEAIQHAERLSTTDGLTNLSNSRDYERAIGTVLNRDDREQYEQRGKTVALIFMDINRFKEEANDKHGHGFGNNVLSYVGEALKFYTRDTDVRARVGGDEFVVVIDLSDTSDPNRLMVNLTKKINDYVQMKIRSEHPGKSSSVSVSMGMSIYRRDARDKDELLAHADEAMFHAKSQGIGCHVYDPKVSYIKKDDRKGRITSNLSG